MLGVSLRQGLAVRYSEQRSLDIEWATGRSQSEAGVPEGRLRNDSRSLAFGIHSFPSRQVGRPIAYHCFDAALLRLQRPVARTSVDEESLLREYGFRICSLRRGANCRGNFLT